MTFPAPVDAQDNSKAVCQPPLLRWLQILNLNTFTVVAEEVLCLCVKLSISSANYRKDLLDLNH